MFFSSVLVTKVPILYLFYQLTLKNTPQVVSIPDVVPPSLIEGAVPEGSTDNQTGFKTIVRHRVISQVECPICYCLYL